MLKRHFLLRLAASGLAAWALLQSPAHAQAEGPDALVKRVSSEVMDAARADPAIQAGDVSKVMALVDSKVMPHVNFQRMTASAVGRYWRQATPEQQQRLQAEFKTLLVRTYSGALAQVKDQKVELKPFRGKPEEPEVTVRTEVRGKGEPIQLDYPLVKSSPTIPPNPYRATAPDQETVVRSEVRGGNEPIQLDYRLEKAGDGWKIYDVNVLGVWLVENYRNSFAQEISAGGIDGLIAKLAERNKTAGAKG